MNPKTKKEAESLAKSVIKGIGSSSKVDVVIAPPHVFLGAISGSKAVSLGAQDAFYEPSGSQTGEVSPLMVKSLGVKYVILGHSSRRARGETDEVIAKKVIEVLKSGLVPIVCIGERERDHDGRFLAAIKDQLMSAFSKVARKDITKVIVTYEPVWAISANKSSHPASPGDANEAALFIRKTLAHNYGIPIAKKVRIIYGGSSNAKNAESFLAEREVAGLLVGSASLNAKEFVEMVKCAR